MPSFYCYLLRSLQCKNSSATYIGFTVDPHHRLRQHNGEIANGAFKTSKRRPWMHVVLIGGFPNKFTALQFEWQWQHSQKARVLSKTSLSANSRISGVKSKLFVLCHLLKAPLWAQLNLTIYVVDSTYYSALSEMLTCNQVSAYFKEVSPKEVEILCCNGSHSNSDNGLCVENSNGCSTCSVCNTSDNSISGTGWLCSQCGCFAHLLCSAKLQPDVIIPQVLCCIECKYQVPMCDLQCMK